jgi:hypothetical protein
MDAQNVSHLDTREEKSFAKVYIIDRGSYSRTIGFALNLLVILMRYLIGEKDIFRKDSKCWR